jgi:NADPH2:quinone reductase
MQAMQLTRYNTALALVDLPVPTPGPGEVLIRIAACGLNFADTLLVNGTYQEKPPCP